MDKTPVPGQGYFAYCTDTEGNVFGIFEANEKAGQEAGQLERLSRRQARS
jgi:hypothetical protein